MYHSIPGYVPDFETAAKRVLGDVSVFVTSSRPQCGLPEFMRFLLIDRIVDFQPGAQITAVKSLTMAEEYLADHFPNFPVMPGVLMLEAMTQAAAWLIRLSED
ncbi:MAG: hypothetical protein ABSG53_07735, partial [Thermoguttaceae bacterium]